MAVHNINALNGNHNVDYLDAEQPVIKVPDTIIKRDGRAVPFEVERIENAMKRCFASFGRRPHTHVAELAQRVVNIIAAKSNDQSPTVEEVQDIVEMVLQAAGEFEAAKRYILYRAEHAKKREDRPIPADVRRQFAASDKYFPTALQKFQFFDKYSRFSYELGRRETWIETVDRSVSYLHELAGDRLPSETYERIRRAILEMRAMPSMRLLAMAGPAARRNNITIYNCLSGDEHILTRERGVVLLKDAVGPVTVLNKNREWVAAEVRSFGQQETVELEFGRFKAKKRVRATLNHEWVLTDGRRITTEELSPGDEISYTVAPRSVDTTSIDYRLGLMHGIVYGDGAETYAQERSNGYLIRLCGDSRELLECFNGYPHTLPPSYNGDPVVYLYDDFAKTHRLKELPADNETDDYLVGFIRGWFAADGYVSKGGQILFATDDLGEAFLRRVGPRVGFDFGYTSLMPDETNFGVRHKKVRNLEVRRASVNESDFILSKHIRNYREATQERNWKMLEVVPGSMRVEDVFCATVPDTHTFTLAEGLLTGNCSYQPVESIDSFVEALIISMSGCGVGYSVESKYVENFPRIKRQTGTLAPTFVVEDSAEGWADALRHGLETWFDGGDVRFDLSQLRPAGAPLRTKGGRASGPGPLRTMLDFVRARILARQGSILRPLDAHDIMCAVGNAAVSGGVRRTAMISLFDYDDLEMLSCKSGDFERDNSQRWNANNSAVWPDGVLTQMEFIRQFTEMVESGRGEPGIFNRAAANALKPARRKEAEFGTNPCVTGDTWVLTDKGPRQVSDLVGVPHTTIVDGARYETTEQGFWETSIKPVLCLRTKEGFSLRLTANHQVLAVPYVSRKTERTEWVEAGSLQPGDKIRLHNHRELDWYGDGTFDEGWLLGSLVGDGTFDGKSAKLVFWGEHRAIMAEQAVNRIKQNVSARADLRGHDQPEYDRTIINSRGLLDLAADYGIYRGMKTITPLVEQASSDFYRGFLQGLFDADGTIVGTHSKGVSVRLAQSDADLLHGVQRMLLRLGIVANVYQNRRPAGSRMLPDGYGGSKVYECRADHELIIANDNLQVFAKEIGFSDPDKAERLQQKLVGYQRVANRERFMVTVASIEPDGEEPVYDCSVPDINAFDANGLYVHNCGEINLRPWEFCNLTAAVARKDDTLDTLRDKVEVATIIGTIQSLATHFPGLRPMWQQNCEEERLLGVDITGQMDSPVAQDPEAKAQLRQIAVEVNRETAAALGINQSVSITCVKPSGNSSQLLDCASGLHARWAPYYIRNVRVAAHSPIYKVLRDAGVPMDPENGQTPETATTWVVHFPVKAPEGAITRNDRSAIEQCEYWLQNKVHWTEHNPSCTITYRPYEVIDLIKWVWDHRDQIGGLSFLPAFDAQYAQMPYEEIAEEEYNRLVAEFPHIDFSKLYRYEYEDFTTAAQELACTAGVCELDLSEVK